MKFLRFVSALFSVEPQNNTAKTPDSLRVFFEKWNALSSERKQALVERNVRKHMT